jgi:hypothetical protein
MNKKDKDSTISCLFIALGIGLLFLITWLSSSDIGPDWFQTIVDGIANAIVDGYKTGKQIGEIGGGMY